MWCGAVVMMWCGDVVMWCDVVMLWYDDVVMWCDVMWCCGDDVMWWCDVVMWWCGDVMWCDVVMSDLVLGSRRGRGSTLDRRRCHRGSTGSHTGRTLLWGRLTRRAPADRSTSQRTSSWWNECSDTGGQTTARSSHLSSYTVSVSSSLLSRVHWRKCSFYYDDTRLTRTTRQ